MPFALHKSMTTSLFLLVLKVHKPTHRQTLFWLQKNSTQTYCKRKVGLKEKAYSLCVSCSVDNFQLHTQLEVKEASEEERQAQSCCWFRLWVGRFVFLLMLHTVRRIIRKVITVTLTFWSTTASTQGPTLLFSVWIKTTKRFFFSLMRICSQVGIHKLWIRSG